MGKGERSVLNLKLHQVLWKIDADQFECTYLKVHHKLLLCSEISKCSSNKTKMHIKIIKFPKF